MVHKLSILVGEEENASPIVHTKTLSPSETVSYNSIYNPPILSFLYCR